MTPLIVLGVIGFFALACFRAYQSAKLLERDAEAWERQQQFEDEKRRRRQQALGSVTTKGVNIVKSWLKKEGES